MHKILLLSNARAIILHMGGVTMFFFFDYKPYVAIIGDIKNSKKIIDRKNTQDKLNNVLKMINEKYEEEISAKFMITLGDEFQGLLYGGKRVLDIIEEIQMEMYPVQIRFGIGVGEITTNINSEMAIGADGPGYYKARAAIENIKQSEQKNMTQSSDIRIEIEDDEYLLSLTLNTIFLLMTVIQRNWSQRQREIIWEYDKYGCNQSECAKRLNITQSSVQRSLTSGNYYAYKNAKESVNTVLKGIEEKHV